MNVPLEWKIAETIQPEIVYLLQKRRVFFLPDFSIDLMSGGGMFLHETALSIEFPGSIY